jgi:hypothetical protein
MIFNVTEPLKDWLVDHNEAGKLVASVKTLQVKNAAKEEEVEFKGIVDDEDEEGEEDGGRAPREDDYGDVKEFQEDEIDWQMGTHIFVRLSPLLQLTISLPFYLLLPSITLLSPVLSPCQTPASIARSEANKLRREQARVKRGEGKEKKYMTGKQAAY